MKNKYLSKAKMADRLDIVVMGATGFTGMHCIPYLHKQIESGGYNFSWGIAGRSEEKLKQVLQNMGKNIGADLSEIPVIICNTDDDESLFKMAQKTKLVINCVGPYILYGEKVVDACIKAGTHHVDISGEPNYMESMQLKKNAAAKEKGVYVVSACGLDSIPCDLGIIFLEQNFSGVLNSTITYIKFYGEGKVVGSVLNYGTWASAVYSMEGGSKLNEIRRQLFPKLPTFTPKITRRNFPYKSRSLKAWVLPFFGADRFVAERTQRYFYESENKRPVQIDTRWVVESGFQVILFLIIGVIFLLFSRFKCGRKLLLDYPEKFSFGLFSKNPPSEEAIENSAFEISIRGEGWSQQSNNANGQYLIGCDKKMIARVTGKNPGYGSTCIMVVFAALTILSERENLAGNGKGGVYPPGAAFAKTSILKKLNENGVRFEIVTESI